MAQKKPTLITAKKEALRYLDMIKKDGFKVRYAYLFGSFAESRQRLGSDVDLLIGLRGFKDVIKAGGALYRKLSEFRTSLTLDIIANTKSKLDPGIPLESEVLRKGIKLN